MTSTNTLNGSPGFNHWVEHTLFKPEHKLGTDILERAVDIHLISLYRELGLHELLSEYNTARKLAAALQFSDSAYIALSAMLYRLASRHNFVEVAACDNDDDIESCYFRPLSKPDSRNGELPALYDNMKSLGPDYAAPMEFLEFGREHFIRSLRDDHEFMDRVLTGQEKDFAETWDRATNTDPLQDIHGIMGAKAVEMLFDGGSILEIGGGTGNGLRNNLDALIASNKTSSLDRYIFTDVSMPFILNTKRALQQRYSEIQCEWRLLNINKDWEAQRLEANSVSMVYGVNAAHIAMHTVDFLIECKRVLKSGGFVVFSERLRRFKGDMAPREIVLNLSSYHRTAAIRHPEYRPAHAYLSEKDWLRACELAGFKDASVWPSSASSETYFPDQYASVVVAQR